MAIWKAPTHAALIWECALCALLLLTGCASSRSSHYGGAGVFDFERRSERGGARPGAEVAGAGAEGAGGDPSVQQRQPQHHHHHQQQQPHPRLLFGTADVRALRSRANSTHAHLTRALRRAAHAMLARPDVYLPPRPAADSSDTASWAHATDSFRAGTTDSATSTTNSGAAEAAARRGRSGEPGPRWAEIYGSNVGALAMHCVLAPADRAALALALDFTERLAEQSRRRRRHQQQQQVIRMTPRLALSLSSSSSSSSSFSSGVVHEEHPSGAHTLLGLATAVDLLYAQLNASKRRDHLDALADATGDVFSHWRARPWSAQPTDGRAVTGMLAVLTGALVLEPHRTHRARATRWKRAATGQLQRAMLLLEHVVDGSLQEGVAYGSYASRALTQYVFLALRHLGIDHTRSGWLREHYWFYLATVLPGFRRTVGIADSNYNWFYGPESQLVFLDTYVLRNGSGNWLAQQIRRHRPRDGPMEHSSAWRWATLHTEFVWYDPRLVPKPPEGHGKPRLHLFTDWGVLTHGGGLALDDRSTFVSFKSGPVGGTAARRLAQCSPYRWLNNGMGAFNPAHEHPDQNSFTFAPNGRAFVSEALYGHKYTYLNNALVFAPSPSSKCHRPWEGQLGECGQFMEWAETDAGTGGLGAGKLITASQHGDMVFTSGEAVEAYGGGMMLRSVYRALVLLNTQTLLVLDHIERAERSPVNLVSAFFHNLDYDVRYVPLSTENGYRGALMDDWDAHYKMFWVDDQGNSPKARIQEAELMAEMKKRWTQYVNVTFPMQSQVTRIAYMFHGPFVNINNLKFIESSKYGVRLSVCLDNVEKVISIATKHDDPVARHGFLGFGGFAVVEDRSKVTYFGQGTVIKPKHKHETVFVLRISIIFMGISSVTGVVLVAIHRKSSVGLQKIARSVFLILIIIWLLEILVVQNVCFQELCGNDWANLTSVVASEVIDELPLISLDAPQELPTVVIASLPASGAEVVSQLFVGNSDFVYIPIPSLYFRPPSVAVPGAPSGDACKWPLFSDHSDELPETWQWFRSLVRHTRTHVQNAIQATRLSTDSLVKGILRVNSTRHVFKKKGGNGQRKCARSDELGNIQRVRKHLDSFPNSRLCLGLNDGNWNNKLPSLKDVIGPAMKALYVVCDPRTWVYSMMHSCFELPGKPAFPEGVCLKIARHLDPRPPSASNASEGCGDGARPLSTPRELPWNTSVAAAALLASAWRDNTATALRSHKQLTGDTQQLIRVEDVVRYPREVAGRVYSFLGLPLPPSALNQILFTTRTGVVSPAHRGLDFLSVRDAWRVKLSPAAVREIESVCWPLMKILGYGKFEN
ncbi:dermatan-sulfate epimerase-like protein [Petromyzon marinus]|uniref:dermatan-sulfate epimerase-like protein n=1 Tax=Petromyzon marinus TaxID=7757 RepID=UPI003F6EE654